MKRILILLLPLLIWSTSTWGKEYQYKADVKGMVCSFCAYSVGKNISKLPGVIKESVDVSLKNGEVRFRSTSRVTQTTLEPLFIKSGFNISGLTEEEVVTEKSLSTNDILALELKLPYPDIDKFESVIKAIGDMAASGHSRIEVKAPESLEMDILKPLLMGRQQVIKVDFIPEKQAFIFVRLFDAGSM